MLVVQERDNEMASKKSTQAESECRCIASDLIDILNESDLDTEWSLLVVNCVARHLEGAIFSRDSRVELRLKLLELNQRITDSVFEK